MLDELIRQGRNDERILIYMATEYPEYVFQVGIQTANLYSGWIRIRQESQDIELHGVPLQSRATYRSILVKGVGHVMAPWNSSALRCAAVEPII
jgi:hypothetical protein